VATESTDQRKQSIQSQDPSLGLYRIFDPAREGELTSEQIRQQLDDALSFSNRVRSLNEIALQIDAARTQEGILSTLRHEIQLIEQECCFIALLAESRTHYVIRSLSTLVDATGLDGKEFRLSEGMPGWVIDHRTPVCTPIATAPAMHPDIEGVLQDLEMKHLLIVPLQTSEDTIGALVLSNGRMTSYPDQELWITQLMALHAAIALKNLNLFEDAKKRITQIELVNEIAEKLTFTLELDSLLKSAAETIRSAFNYFDVTIFMKDADEGDLRLVAHSGNYPDFLPTDYRQPFDQGIVGWVARNGEKVMANDVTRDVRYMAQEYHNTQSELTVPIRVEGKVVGVVNVEDTKLHAFDETDAIVLETLCDQLGSAINNARLYEQVRKTNTTLKELDRMKSDFLSIVSHDFRAPLASVILAAKAMMKRGTTMDQHRQNDYLTIIVDQAEKLRQLAEDTLSITKLESGQLSYHFRVVNVERLIKDAQGLVNFSRRHSMESSVHPNVSYINGDQTKLRQLMHNILNNAVKYSPRGGVVRVAAEPYSEDEVLFSVSDEGIGIPPDQMSCLFQKFSRVNTPEAREIKGSGLGLWICKEIVTGHGGRIWVESEVGKGTTFKFTLKTAHGGGQGSS
jgi:K+-sensing histidine kinase KdpD